MTIKDNVEALLKRDDETGILCRNNDNFLILCYIQTYHENLNVDLNGWTTNKDLCMWAKNLPALSELKRIRADFQNNKGLYLAEASKREQRQIKAEEKREEYRQ